VFVEQLFEHQTLYSSMVFDQHNGVVRTPKKWYIHLKRIEFGVDDNIFLFFFLFYIEFNINPFKNPDQPLQFIFIS
jgi:hypothetical protein